MSSKKSVYAIGGVGGSGTRVIAELIMQMGYFMGDDLNESNDNLLFTLLFKRESVLMATDEEFAQLVDIFLKHTALGMPLDEREFKLVQKLASSDRTLHTSEWLRERLKYLGVSHTHSLWGFKEPNSHIVIERMMKLMPELKFVYVYRDGRDMAYSSNQNQLHLWGSIFFDTKEIAITPKNSLKYWISVHKRVLKLQEKYPQKIMLLNFDALCQEPRHELLKLAQFMQCNSDKLFGLEHLISPPSSIGRYKENPLGDFNSEDLEMFEKITKVWS